VAKGVLGMQESTFDLVIVGAGPGGLSAAARAGQQGMSHVLLEAGGAHANTIQQYQQHKHVMAEPSVLPLRSDMEFAAGRREAILESWERGISSANVNIKYHCEVAGIRGSLGNFEVSTKSGNSVRGKHVILALGVQGHPRRVTVPGGDLPCVQYTLESADALRGETIVVIGAGDAAIENAIALSRSNSVIVLNRNSGFPRAKDANAARITRAISAGRIKCFMHAEVRSVHASSGHAKGQQANDKGAGAPYRMVISTQEGERTLPCHRVIARLGAIPPRQLVESIGVRFLSSEPDALPELSSQYESTVPGLYVIGALAGYPLIKQAMNQGFEVVEHLLGRAVAPADHDILRDKFRILRGGDDVERIVNLIHKGLPLFRGIQMLALRELLLVSRIVTPAKGSSIFARGDYASSIFNVLRGEAHLGAGGTPMILRGGQLLGEMSLISGRPHETSAIAGADCILLETPHSAIRKLLRTEQSVRAYIDTVYSLRALRLLLMPHASPETIHALSKAVSLHRFAPGAEIFKEGDPIERFYLVRSGSVALSRRTADQDTVVAYCAANSFLDALGCLSGETTRSLNAKSMVATEALSIDHASFKALLKADALLAAKMDAERTEQLTQYAHMQARPKAGNVFSYLMSHGLGEATSVLVIDETLCVGCDQCEKACAATHEGVSRLDRSAGPSLHSLHLPTSCRHCEHPHCMRDCPPSAIHRLPNGEVFIDETCIGCGNCEENCPYGVIQMAEKTPKTSLLAKLLGTKPAEGAKTAVKCDVCASLKGGPACVRACPTGAAIRIHAEDVLELARQRAVALE
jgi:Fe-S-cluster-containing hydrogenase component 2/thioredoxin reductase/CRP-like cAMP-binding protein